MSEPYYSDEFVTLYHGDCRNRIEDLTFDVVVTDPPYGQSFKSGWTGAAIQGDESTAARDHALGLAAGKPAIVFGSPQIPPPKGTRHRLIWHRPGSGMGDLSLPWQPDFEMVFVIGDGFAAPKRGRSVLVYPWDTFRGDAYHPHQKPLGLLRDLISKCPPGVILDPFMGSGSTLRAAKDLGRRAIGIELDERYCEIAARRLAQGVLDFGVVS